MQPGGEPLVGGYSVFMAKEVELTGSRKLAGQPAFRTAMSNSGPRLVRTERRHKGRRGTISKPGGHSVGGRKETKEELEDEEGS